MDWCDYLGKQSRITVFGVFELILCNLIHVIELQMCSAQRSGRLRSGESHARGWLVRSAERLTAAETLGALPCLNIVFRER